MLETKKLEKFELDLVQIMLCSCIISTFIGIFLSPHKYQREKEKEIDREKETQSEGQRVRERERNI